MPPYRPHRQRTDKQLSEADWQRVFSLFEEQKNRYYSFSHKEREKKVLCELYRNGNKPLSEAAICKLLGVVQFDLGQCQTANVVFAYHGYPYRLYIVLPRDSTRYFKLYICEKPGETTTAKEPLALEFQHD